MTAPIPDTETARLDALRQCYLLDTAPEEAFDDLARLAAQICGTPIAAVSLIDADRQWFKSILGLNVTQTPREDAFCAHTILQHDALIVPDAAADERFSANPLVTGDPNIRFYAGAPLVTAEGHALGSLCVIDRIPRQLTPEQVSSLQILARQVVSQIELTRRVATQERLIGAREQAHDHLETRVQERTAALQVSEERYRFMADAMPQIVWTATPDGSVDYYNQRWYEYTGLTFEQTKDWGWEAVVHPEDLQNCVAHWTHSLTTGEPYEVEYRFQRASDGACRWHLGRAFPLRDPAGKIIQWVGGCTDIHDHKEAEQALRRAHDELEDRVRQRTAELASTSRMLREDQARLEQAQALAHVGSWEIDCVTGDKHWSAEMFRIFGLLPTSEPPPMDSSLNIVHPEDRAAIYACMQEALTTGKPYRLEHRVVWANGTERHVQARCEPLRGEAGVLLALQGTAVDITERKQAEQTLKDFSVVLEFQKLELEKTNAELEALATMDGLTNLRNRRAFDARLKEEFERATRYQTPLSLVLLDIDHFKHYNDTFGHQAGDEALRIIGRILQKSTRETDIVARYGGEEMALILPETDGDGASHVAERVRMAIATALWDKRAVTASLGISTLRLGMAHPEEMVASADRALYQSKADGRNRITHGYNLEPAPAYDAQQYAEH